MQKSIDFGQKSIKYCFKCNIQYNSTNINDRTFHNKLHNKTKPSRISKYIHKTTNGFSYGLNKTDASCKLSKTKDLIHCEIFYKNEKAKNELVNFIKAIFNNYKIEICYTLTEYSRNL